MIDDDRFIFDTLDQWCFGKDNSGDIMSKDNIAELIEAASQIQPVQLVNIFIDINLIFYGYDCDFCFLT